jgi:hypothetical protein
VTIIIIIITRNSIWLTEIYPDKVAVQILKLCYIFTDLLAVQLRLLKYYKVLLNNICIRSRPLADTMQQIQQRHIVNDLFMMHLAFGTKTPPQKPGSIGV